MEKDRKLRDKISHMLGRKLKRFEILHHLDNDHFNDDLENLTIIYTGEHSRVHRNAMYRHLVKLVTVADVIRRLAMLEDLNKLLDVIENMLGKVDANDPKEVNELEAFASRLESLVMEIKDRPGVS